MSVDGGVARQFQIVCRKPRIAAAPTVGDVASIDIEYPIDGKVHAVTQCETAASAQ